MANRSDLPPWLRNGARAGAGAPATKRRAASAVAFALVVFAAGGLTGYLVAGRQTQTVAPPPPPPACPRPRRMRARACAGTHATSRRRAGGEAQQAGGEDAGAAAG